MLLSKIISKESFATQFNYKTKDDALQGIAELASRNPLLKNWTSTQLYEAFAKKEQDGSTGFGDGIAIPHIHLEGLADFVLFVATSTKGVPFDALDKKKTYIFFIILGPAERINDHLQILALISRTFSDQELRKELLSAKTDSRLVEIFAQHTYLNNNDIKLEKQKMKLLYVILYIEEMLYHIMEYFIQEGVEGASIIEAQGMNAYISNVPLFASFIGFMNEKKSHSKIIMAMIPEKQIDDIVKGIEGITGNLDKQEGAMIIVQDVLTYKGSMNILR